MSRRARLGFVAIILYTSVLGFLAPRTPLRAQSATLTNRLFLPGIVVQPASSWSAPELAVFNLINQQRRANGCPEVKMSDELANAARAHSKDMADKNFVSHTGSSGSSFSQRAKAAGYQFFPSGEIIAAGQSTPNDAVTSWMNSSGHRSIILTCANDDIGVGYVDKAGSQYRFYWTVVFGQR